MIKSTNIMVISGHPASVVYESEIKAFRGQFLDVNGYCDFVADSIDGLQKEGAISLTEFVETCIEEEIAPFKEEDKLKAFTLRYPAWLETRLNATAAAHAISKNQFIVQLLERELVTR
ncbi:type II toxin-antitoxin system HicB family antitoxin [Proteus sp. CD3]|uniref:type II toxin-antitoxin system HicB family antitoxin n=1 Tax=Proteus sp. CD3 TaxID=1921565 RepID=UPI00124A7576|nr:type II toxin-antitoxin system HicB family antitoxin [Proteus sp. CD3]QEZ91531.1 DNA repair protein [Proteus sp. CD3]